MSFIEGLSIGIAAIRSNKMRSLLTMLGIIIGIAAVLAHEFYEAIRMMDAGNY